VRVKEILAALNKKATSLTLSCNFFSARSFSLAYFSFSFSSFALIFSAIFGANMLAYFP